jgi:SAM-dependent methyltransferase
MLRELIHLARHAPHVLVLKHRLDQVELYETLMERADDAGLAERRRALAAGLHGDVLEIGCGTGRMFRHYASDVRVDAIDVDEAFVGRARSRAPSNVNVALSDAQALPCPDASFDAVVACLVLCSIPDPARALSEARRVLRSGGELRLVEHVVSERKLPATLMHWIDPLWLWMNEQGCHMNRDTAERVREVFGAVDVQPFQVFSAGLPAFPMCVMRATRA